MGLYPDPTLSALVTAIATIAAVADHQRGRIPNRIVVLGCAALLLARAVSAAAQARLLGVSLLMAAGGSLAAGAIPLFLYCRGAIGAGDVKLLAVCGAGLGPVLGCQASLFAFAIGGCCAVVQSARAGKLGQLLSPRRPQLPLTPFRFGPAICAGVIAALLQIRS